MQKYKVYIKLDENNRITAINSGIFIKDLTGWIELDSGSGMEYLHAQSSYFKKPIRNEYGALRFKYVDGKAVEIPEEEVEAETKNIIAKITPATEERIKKIEEAINKLLKLFG